VRNYTFSFVAMHKATSFNVVGGDHFHNMCA